MIDKYVLSLKSRREEYGISQGALATRCGISRTYINLLESGKKPLTEKMRVCLEEALDRLNPDTEMTMLIDYVRIRFITTDTRHVIEDVLGMKMEYMLHEDYGYYGYPEHYEFGTIFVMSSIDEEKGTLLELKGQGSRQYEGVLEAQGRDWYSFFIDCINEGCVFKRIDLAINDIRGILDIPRLTEKCDNEECVSVFRNFKSYRSGELTKKDEKIGMGYTLYIGSMKSDVYFCVYEKDYEQYVKNDIPIEDVPVKNRFEVRLKNDRAAHAVEELLVYRDGEEVAFGIINRYIRFVDRDDKKAKEDWEVNDRWAWFLGEGRQVLKLTSQPEPYSFRRTLNWLAHQVAPTWKLAQKVDEIRGTKDVATILDNAQLSQRHEKLLKQCEANIEDVIFTDWKWQP